MWGSTADESSKGGRLERDKRRASRSTDSCTIVSFFSVCRIMWICWIRIKIIVELFILWFVYMNVLNTTYTLLRSCVLCCYMQSIIGCQDITRYQDSKNHLHSTTAREKYKITQKQNISTISQNSTSQNNSSHSGAITQNALPASRNQGQKLPSYGALISLCLSLAHWNEAA